MDEETKVRGTEETSSGVPKDNVDDDEFLKQSPKEDPKGENSDPGLGNRLSELIALYNTRLENSAVKVKELMNDEQKKEIFLKRIESSKLTISPEELSRITNYFIDNVLPIRTDDEKQKVMDSFVGKIENLLKTNQNSQIISLALSNLPEVYRHLSSDQIRKWERAENEQSFKTDGELAEFYSLRGKGALGLYQKQKGRKWPVAVVAGLIGAAAMGSFWAADYALNPLASKLGQCQSDQNNLAVCRGQKDKLKEDLANYKIAKATSQEQAALCDSQMASCLEENEYLALAVALGRESLDLEKGVFGQREKDYASCQAELISANSARKDIDKAYVNAKKDLNDCIGTLSETGLALADCVVTRSEKALALAGCQDLLFCSEVPAAKESAAEPINLKLTSSKTGLAGEAKSVNVEGEIPSPETSYGATGPLSASLTGSSEELDAIIGALSSTEPVSMQKLSESVPAEPVTAVTQTGPAVSPQAEPVLPVSEPVLPVSLALPLAELVPTNIYYPKIQSALEKPEAERLQALASVVAEYLQNNGGRIIVDGRTCQEALTNLHNKHMLAIGISGKEKEVIDSFVKYSKGLCGPISPYSGRVVFEINDKK